MYRMSLHSILSFEHRTYNNANGLQEGLRDVLNCFCENELISLYPN